MINIYMTLGKFNHKEQPKTFFCTYRKSDAYGTIILKKKQILEITRKTKFSSHKFKAEFFFSQELNFYWTRFIVYYVVYFFSFANVSPVSWADFSKYLL